MLVTGASQEVALQSQRYSLAIGRAVPISTIEDIREFARDASLPSFYSKEDMEDIWYEMLEKEGLSRRIGDVADSWVTASILLLALRYSLLMGL